MLVVYEEVQRSAPGIEQQHVTNHFWHHAIFFFFVTLRGNSLRG